MNKKIAAFALASGLAVALGLAGCSSQASFTQLLGNASVDLNGLNGTAESTFELAYTDIAFDVELESGTVDVEIHDVVTFEDDDTNSDVVELDTIYEGKGLASGDRATLTDDDGAVLVRVTSSDGATGKITFSDAG